MATEQPTWPDGYAARTGPDAQIATFTPSEPDWAGHEVERYVPAFKLTEAEEALAKAETADDCAPEEGS